MKKLKVSIILALAMTLLSSTLVSAAVQQHSDTAEGTSRESRHRSGLEDIEDTSRESKQKSGLEDIEDSDFWDLVEYYANRNLELDDSDDSVDTDEWITMLEDTTEGTGTDEMKGSVYINNNDAIIGVVVSDGYAEGLVDRISGAYVEEVMADGPAYNAGISVGDLITEVNGKEIKNKQELVYEISKCKPFDTITLTITLVNSRGYYKEMDYTMRMIDKATYNRVVQSKNRRATQHNHNK